VVDVFCRTTTRNFFAFTLNGRQLQGFEVMLQQNGSLRFGLLHELTSDDQGLVSGNVRLWNANQLQVRSTVQTVDGDGFFLLMLDDQHRHRAGDAEATEGVARPADSS
jgi:hypothetical protein